MEFMEGDLDPSKRTHENSEILVTGASRGISLAIAQRLAASGHRLTIVSRNPEDLDLASSSLDASHRPHIGISADLMSSEGINKTLSQTNLTKLSGVVHNMGTWF